MRYYYTFIRMPKKKMKENLTTPNADKYVEEKELSFAGGKNAKRCRHFEGQFLMNQ